MTVQFQKIDDAALQQLAAEPANPLFGILYHASAMAPWVILLAALPSLYAVVDRPLTDVSALWGVKAISVASAANLSQIVDPGAADQSIPFHFQPPLISWLAALCIRVLGTWTDSAVFAASYLATVAFVVTTYRFATRLGDAKLGLLTVAILGFHSDVLAMSQVPSPVAIGLCFAVAAFWGFFVHLERSTTLLSAGLLWGGIALGFCALAGGALAILVVVTLMLYLLGTHLLEMNFGGHSRERHSGNRDFRTLLLSLAVMALTGFAIGGWWELMMFYQFGPEFWRAWLLGTEPAVANLSDLGPQNIQPSSSALAGMGELLMVLAGPAVYGVCRAVRDIRHSEQKAIRRVLRFLISWFITAILMWQLSSDHVLAGSWQERAWQGFLLIPLSILSAWGLLQLADGRAGLGAAAITGLISAANLFFHAPTLSTGAKLLLFLLLTLIGGLGVMAMMNRGSTVGTSRREPRLLVTLLLITIAVGHGVWSFSRISRSEEARGELSELKSIKRAFAQIDAEVASYTIISPHAGAVVPPQLQFLAKCAWPHALSRTVDPGEAIGKTTEESSRAANPKTATKDSPVHVWLLWRASQTAFPAAIQDANVVRFDEYFRHQQLAILVQPQTEF